jgi:hypothetical protein
LLRVFYSKKHLGMASIILHTFGVGLLSTSLLATELTAQVRPERFCNGDIYIRASEKLSDMPVYKVVRMIGKVNGAKLVVFVMTHDSLGSTQALVEFFGTLEAVFYRSEDVSILVCLPLPHLACPNHSLEIIQVRLTIFSTLGANSGVKRVLLCVYLARKLYPGCTL